jgi:hypothetical protein
VAVQVPPPRPKPRPDPDLQKDHDAFARGQAQADDAAKEARLPQAPPPAGVRIPEHYGEPGRSGLSFDLRAPQQDYSIDLE